MALCECGAEPTDNINGEKYCRSCGEHVRRINKRRPAGVF